MTVQDITNPELTLTGDASVNVEAGTTYTDAGATCSDDFDGVITPTSVSTVNTGVSGTYTVTWSCSDTSGNSDDDVVRTVVVADTIAPTMSVTGGTSIQVEADMTEFYTDAGATCSDTFEGNLDAQVQVGGDIVRRSIPGTYTVDYTCLDSSNNQVTASRTVTVVDTINGCDPNSCELPVSMKSVTIGATVI